MDSLAAIITMAICIASMGAALVYLVRMMIIKNPSEPKESKSEPEKKLNGHYATSKELSEVHDRISDNVGKQNEHCRIQVAACSTLHTQFAAQDAKHDARYDSILAILKRIEGNGKH